MLSVRRLYDIRPILRNSKKFYTSTSQLRSVKLEPLEVAIEKNQTYEQRNYDLSRPLSPHLTIYKPQLTSVLSITHRMTGIALTSYIIALGVDPHQLIYAVDLINEAQLAPAVIIAGKSILAFPVSYHIANGIRHLIWDTGRSLTNQAVIASGYTMLATAVVLTAIFVSL